jgi:hypothetical protein
MAPFGVGVLTDRAAAREAEARYRKSHRVVLRERGRERARVKREWVREQKGTVCAWCGGEFPPQKLVFHHRDPSTKLFVVSGSDMYNRTKLEAEIAKCDVVCVGCHVRHHRVWLAPRSEHYRPRRTADSGQRLSG